MTGFATDNAVSALGKTILYQPEALAANRTAAVGMFMGYLPVTVDEEEGVKVSFFLSFFLSFFSSPSLFLSLIFLLCVHLYTGTRDPLHKCWWSGACLRLYSFIHNHPIFLFMYNHSFVHSCMHAFIHSLSHSCMHSFIHSCMRSFIHACMR